ncbi:hypothetical protein AB9P05_14250 [Roseivirga sp. BDSF3-8]|uniref:hypothetical protein n=1 Tax=Roseivirga sp. BDSF3-8 TaxID=3241598 RepID=UPI0035320EDA
MKKILLYVVGVFCCAIACKPVAVSTSDSIPPDVTLNTYTQGIRNKTTVEANGSAAEMKVAVGEKVYFIGTGYDSLGLRDARVAAVSGGMLRVNNNNLIRVTVHENDTTVDSTGVTVSSKNALLAGEVEFDRPDQEVVLRARSTDWAGNAAVTPTLTIVPLPKPVARLSADRTVVEQGEAVTLTYETEHADTVKINGNVQNTRNGTRTFNPGSSVPVILEAINEVGRDADTIEIRVTMPPALPQINTFTLNKSTADEGESVRASWNVSNATQVRLYRNGSRIHTNSDMTDSHSFSINNSGNYTIKLEATGAGGTSEYSRSLTITEPAPQMPVESCSNMSAWWAYVAKDAIQSYWIMDLSNLITGDRISTVKNLGGSDILVRVSGREVLIPAGGSSSGLNGISFSNRFEAYVGNPNALGVALEFCKQ